MVMVKQISLKNENKHLLDNSFLSIHLFVVRRLFQKISTQGGREDLAKSHKQTKNTLYLIQNCLADPPAFTGAALSLIDSSSDGFP